MNSRGGVVSALAVATLLAAAPLGGCKYSKETVPVSRDNAAIRVPNQQRIVALAVEQAVDALDFAELSGKSVTLEFSGVFPHSDVEVLAYVRTQLSTRLTRQGVRVIEPAPTIVLPGGAVASTGATTVVLSDPADYTLKVGVAWGGIDTRDRVRTDEPLLTKQVGLGVGGLLAGLALLTIWDNKYGIILGVGSALRSPLGAWYWSRKETPFPHTYTLIGRVRLLVHATPTAAGTPITKEGVGESRILVDDTSAEGYMLSR